MRREIEGIEELLEEEPDSRCTFSPSSSLPRDHLTFLACRVPRLPRLLQAPPRPPSRARRTSITNGARRAQFGLRGDAEEAGGGRPDEGGEV